MLRLGTKTDRERCRLTHGDGPLGKHQKSLAHPHPLLPEVVDKMVGCDQLTAACQDTSHEIVEGRREELIEGEI